jgi:hypothetical protein
MVELATALDNKLAFYQLAYPGLKPEGEGTGEVEGIEHPLDMNLNFYL